jgi:lipopolysaccharide transport system permease protein
MPMNSGGEMTAPAGFVIKRSSGWLPLNLHALWEYRELLYFLTWRDIKVRYRQTAFGVAWAIIQPLLLMGAFSIFFGLLAKVPSDGIPYPIFSLSALLPWQLFAHALAQSSQSLVANDKLITKVYFPRLVIPLSAVLSGLMDFSVLFVVFLVVMLCYGMAPTMALLTIPFFVLLAVGSALSVGLWLSALNVQYRDVRYAIPFFIQFWFFVSPVAYPSSLVPGFWRLLYALNPMAGVIDGFRWALLGNSSAPGWELTMSLAVIVLLLVGGLFYFQRVERTFADVV